MSVTAPNMAMVADRLRAGVAARQRAQFTAKASPALIAPAAAASPQHKETVEEVAREALGLLEEALSSSAIQRDSVRMVLACHLAQTRLVLAQSQEGKALLAEARQPMPTSERDAWKREFMAEARAALDEVVKVHRDGAKETVLAIRDEVTRMVRSADNAAAWRAGRLMVACYAAGAATVLGLVLLFWR